MNLLVVGVSHRTAGTPLLERLAVPPGALADGLASLLRRDHVTEAVVLSTCNRVEVYAGVTGFHGGVSDLTAGLAALGGYPDPAPLAPHLYVRWDVEAVTHALRVAAGLDSMVAGESQILGQVRDAYGAAGAAGATGRLLHELMQQALRVGKRARSETGIDLAGRSVVAAAVATAAAGDGAVVVPAAEALPPDLLTGRAGLVVGTGSMAGLSLATLSRAGAGPLLVAGRDPGRAARLASGYGARAVALGELPAALTETDLVVSVTAARQPVLTGETVTAAAAARRPGRGPLVICDLAMPRDVEAAVGAVPGVVLIDLARVGAAMPTRVSVELAAAEQIVAEEAESVGEGLRDGGVAPTVAALRSRADEVMAAELGRLARRRPDLTGGQRAAVAQAMHRLVQRLLHQPTVRVRQLGVGPGGDSYASALAELFDLQVPWPRRADQVPDLDGAGAGGSAVDGPATGYGAGGTGDRDGGTE